MPTDPRPALAASPPIGPPQRPVPWLATRSGRAFATVCTVLYAIEALYVLGMGALLVVFDAAMTRFEGEPVEASSVLDDVAVVAFLVVGLTAGCYATTKVGKVMPWFVRAGALAATAAINALGACSFGRDLVHGLLNPVEFQSLGFGAGDLLGDAAVLVGCLVLGTHAALLACADVTAWRQRVPAT